MKTITYYAKFYPFQGIKHFVKSKQILKYVPGRNQRLERCQDLIRVLPEKNKDKQIRIWNGPCFFFLLKIR